MKTEDSEALTITVGRSRCGFGSTIGVGVGLGRARADVDECTVQVGVADLGKTLLGATTGRYVGQASLDKASVLFDVQSRQDVDGSALRGIEVTPGHQAVREQLGLVEAPGLEGGNKLPTVDQPDLQRE